MLNLLEKSILATIAYYDVLNYPLTGFEVFKYLISPSHIIAQSKPEQSLISEPLKQSSFLKIQKTLRNKSLNNFVEEKNGFYFLKGKNKLLNIRIERQKISDQKWKKARKIIKWLWLIPFLKAVFVSGSLALDNTKEQSDIDLLIIAKHKRIWTVRFLITSFLHIIGKRRYGKKTADRICLNHYITDESLKIDFPSLYNAQTYAHLVLVLKSEKDVYKKFRQANKWINDYVVSYVEQESDDQRLIKERRLLKGFAKLQEIILNTFLGGFLEKLLGFFQKLIIKRHSQKHKKEGRVIADEFQLEFHPASPEANVLETYNQNILKLGLGIKKEKDSGLY